MKLCIVCNSADVRPTFLASDRHYGIPGVYSVVACTGCGLLRLNPVPTEAEMLSLYRSDYYAYQPPPRPRLWKRFLSPLLRTRIPTHDPPFSRPGDFLDVGCGAGEYMLKMRALGWRVYGVEPVLAGADAGRALGLDIRNASLNRAGFNEKSFDYVRLNHSFEHLTNPLETLLEIRRILRPTGKLFIGVPNAASLAFRLFQTHWWYLGVPLHAYTYTPRTLSALVAKAGFRVDSTFYNSNFYSLAGSLQIYFNWKNGRLSDDGWLTRNPLVKMAGTTLARALDVVRQGDAIEIHCSCCGD